MSWSEEQVEKFVDDCYREMEEKQKKLKLFLA